MKPYIYTGDRPSKSAVALAKAMGGRRIKIQGSKFIPGPSKALINWGSYNTLPANCGMYINLPVRVADTSNKRTFFEMCTAGTYPIHTIGDVNPQQVTPFPRIPNWTINPDTAEHWINDDGHTVVARLSLTGHSGAGIIICEPSDDTAIVPHAPLYVKYIKKKHEYRIHFIGSSDTYFVQRKARRHGFENPNWMVRNTAGGFIYVNDADNVGPVPDDVLTQAKLAFNVSQLDFGAVDVIWNDHEEKAYVLEINTAPGLEGKTLEFYRDNLLELINNQ